MKECLKKDPIGPCSVTFQTHTSNLYLIRYAHTQSCRDTHTETHTPFIYQMKCVAKWTCRRQLDHDQFLYQAEELSIMKHLNELCKGGQINTEFFRKTLRKTEMDHWLKYTLKPQSKKATFH
jgi:hypothetical protein